MKEKNLAIIITIIILISGIIIGVVTSIAYISILSGNSISTYNEFNFDKSELNINGTHIKETLNFQTDNKYHTLFRNFESTVTTKNNPKTNSVIMESVSCAIGTPYFRVSGDCYNSPDFTKKVSCPDNTENNEYGCTFGDIYGFEKNKGYQISSEFIVSPENLFKINGEYYIKFIAYGRNSHKSLTLNNNLFITGDAVYTSKYLSNEYTIIYIPYKGDTLGYKIIEKPSFEYDSKENKKLSELTIILLIIGIMLMHLLPAVLFFCSWYFFGKELTEPSVPSQLSQNPTNREPWEVASFFNPPFGKVDSNFFSTMLFEFYRRKIIDLKLIEKRFFGNNLLIKINKEKITNLDPTEKKFLTILNALKESCPKEEIKNDYFNLNKSAKSYSTRLDLTEKYKDFQKLLDNNSKKYLEKAGIIFFTVSMIILMFISLPLMLIGLFSLSIITLVVVLIIATTTSLLIKYKGDFYKEYLEWQSFKRWLKGSPAMRETKFKGVVLWEKYLVYATALGVSKEVLKELRNEGIINEKKYNFYAGVNAASFSFASSSAGSGGFSGAGAGGVGGGGGGGR
ncbi:MAG: DUF2207 domain-containing protein [Candidatus Pacearchaeota archaeon]|jgi:uncharacterized membrane protein